MENRPDVIVINEVKTVSSAFLKQYFKALGYVIIVKKEGGIVIATKPHLKLKNVTSTNHPKILVGRIMTKEVVMRIIGVYGPQETAGIEERQEFYDELSMEMEAGENPVVMGDINAKMEYCEKERVGISSNGKILNDVMMKYNLEAVNFHPECKGKWTRVQLKGGCVEKSVLDYILVQPSCWDKILEVEIDEEKVIAPYGITKKKRVYSDHNVIYVSLDIQSTKTEKAKKAPAQ